MVSRPHALILKERRISLAAIGIICLTVPVPSPGDPSADLNASVVLTAYADGVTARTIDVAIERAIVECMATAGFAYEPVANRPPTESAAERVLRLIGVSDVDEAQRLGYASDPLAEIVIPETPSDPAYLTALRGRDYDHPERVALTDPETGQPTGYLLRSGGCFAEATDRVFGSFENRLEFTGLGNLLEAAGADVIARAFASDEVEAATAEWSDCMASHGFDYDSIDDPGQRAWPEPRPDPAERAAALTDVGCKAESGLAAVFAAQVIEHARAADASQGQVAARWNELLDEILQRSAEVSR